MVELLIGAAIGFFACALFLGALFGFLRFLGVYTMVQERTCKVFILFGNVEAAIEEPGLHFLWPKLGWKALIINWLGRTHEVDLRLDQQYLRSLAVNSEEGAPMGIGIWYEMAVSHPVKYLFANVDPRGSLAANVSNAAVRCLSNMKLEAMLESRHTMSRAVRAEVGPKASDWGYRVGSVYIRKVHFRDVEMIRQIEEKVVNRLRQVTSAIRQDGTNQVNIITSTADRQAAIAFAQAAALRPKIVGAALQKIASDQEVAEAMFEILETQRLLEGPAQLTLLPRNMPTDTLAQFVAAQPPMVTAPVKKG